MLDRTVTAEGVVREYAPPAMTLWHLRHSQIPTHVRLMESLPQKTHRYVACWEISTFLINLRSVEPYRVPYFPEIPTFFVRFPIMYYSLDVIWCD